MTTESDNLPSDNTDAGQDTAAASAAAAGESEGQADDAGGESGEAAKPTRLSVRMSELTSRAKTAEERAAQAEQALAEERAQRGRAPDDDDDDETAEVDVTAAVRKVLETERQTQTYVQTVTSLQSKLMDSGLEGAMLVASGDPSVPFTKAMIEIAADMDNPAQVADYLGKNPAEARRIAGLPPHKMGLEMAKVEAKAKAPKPISQAPEPISGLKTTGSPSAGANDGQSINDWMKARTAQVQGKARA